MSLALSLIAWVRRLRVAGRRRKATSGRSVYERRRFRPEAEQLEEQLPPGSIMTGLGGAADEGAGLFGGTGSGSGGLTALSLSSSGLSMVVTRTGEGGGSLTASSTSGDGTTGTTDTGSPPSTPTPPPSDSNPTNPSNPGSPQPTGDAPPRPLPPPPTASVPQEPGVPADVIYAMFANQPARPGKKRPKKKKPPRKKPGRKPPLVNLPPMPTFAAPPPAAVAPPAATVSTPAGPAFLGIDGVSDVAVGNFGLTNNPTPTLTGTGTPGTQFRLSVDNLPNAQGTVRADGTWQLPLAGRLTDGVHSVKAEEVHGGQPTGVESATLSITVDTTAPQVTLEAPEFTTTTWPSFKATASDAESYGLSSEMVVDVDLNGDGSFAGEELGYLTTFGGVGEVQFAASQEIPEGIYTLRARATDMAGNTGSSPLVSMQVDPYAGYVGSQRLLELTAAWPPDQPEMPGGEGAMPEGQESPREQVKKRFSYLRFDGEDRVGVNVRVTLTKHLGKLQESLEGLGMEVVGTAPDQNLIIGYLPVEKIHELPTLEHFATVTPLYKPVTRAGVVQSQGDPVMKADVFRATYGVDGTGVTVGVLSDSVNALDSNNDGIGGIRESQRTGDLPSRGVNVLKDDPFGTDEGRAMLEIIHDVAPGADLAYYTASVSPQDFGDGIRLLQSRAGADIIVDDIGYFNSPFFNDGVISRAVDDVVAQGATYFSAAGNDGNKGFTTGWRGVTATVGGASGLFADLDPGPNVDVLQQFSLANNQVGALILQWDSAFLEGGSNQQAFQVGTDLRILITDVSGQFLLGVIDDINANTDEALEFMAILNGTGVTQFAMAFQLTNGPAPTQIRWLMHPASFDLRAEYQGNSPMIWGQPAARGAIAVGAVWALQPNAPESFTSVGGQMPFMFARDGTRLQKVEFRRKPDVAGPDGANTSFFGMDVPQDADTRPNFFGTSAAAPHASAAAALLLQQSPQLRPNTIRLALERTAMDLAPPGVDFLTGNGLIQLVNQSAPPPLMPDRFEANETSDQARDMGTLAARTEVLLQQLTIARHASGLPDYDWFRWTASVAGKVDVVVVSDGSGDLEVTLWTVTPDGFLRELARDRSIDRFTRTASANVGGGWPVLVQVKGRNLTPGVFDQGGYDLDVILH